MLNQKYYPFERNRYYYGKLLTARDFENEQTYFNNKRRLLNKVTKGVGVVCGLNVYAADNVSLIIDTGVAIDWLGREIVVAEPLIKKLTTIQGFETSQEEEVYLGIKYDEEKIDLLYAPMSEQGDNGEYNKVKESYTLFIEEVSKVEPKEELMDAFINRQIIYEDKDLVIRQYTPKFTNKTEAMQIQVEIEKYTSSLDFYDLKYDILLQGFKTAEGGSVLEVKLEHFSLEYGEKAVYKYKITPKKQLDERVKFEIKKERFSLIKNNTLSEELGKNIEAVVAIKKGEVWDFILEEYYTHSLDSLVTQATGESIWLAKINLIRTESSYVIDTVKPLPLKQYVYSDMQLMIGERLKEYYPKQQGGLELINKISRYPIEKQANEERFNPSDYLTTGIVDLPIGLNANTKEPIFSDEIMHGLGKGNVYIDLAVEYIHEGKKENSSELILGKAELFDAIGEQKIKAEHAIKLLKDKGTFIIAIRLLEIVKHLTIRVRWFAFKVIERGAITTEPTNQGKMLLLNPDTVVITPRGNVAFSPVFMNVAEAPCIYEVVELEGGTITNMGVYTAPAKEGVYTIKVQSLLDDSLVANAFVVVRQ